jgi:hypothetical protein
MILKTPLIQLSLAERSKEMNEVKTKIVELKIHKNLTGSWSAIITSENSGRRVSLHSSWHKPEVISWAKGWKKSREAHFKNERVRIVEEH